MRKYPLKKEPRDLRDYHFMSATYVRPADLPEQIDLRPHLSPVVDQGPLGSCTANAIVSGLREYLLLQSRDSFTPLSRLFLYWHERELEGHIGEDSGAYIRDGMKVLQQLGVCPERDYPYRVDHFADRPTVQAETDARAYRIAEYHRVLDLDALKAALAEQQPVVIGLLLYESFESPEVASTGKVPLPRKTRERVLGGHAMLAVGYKNQARGQGYVIVRNSWGEGWGDHGYCYIPYRMFRDPSLMLDMWTGK
ncbi:C1 family peptidase [Gordoniibacillus kamchatkensis]